MTQWWPLIAAFWAALLVDCVKVFPSRWWRVLVSGARGRTPRAPARGARRRERPPPAPRFRACGKARLGRVVFAPPLPVAWQAYADDFPFAFSPEGICNITTGAIGGAPPTEPRVAQSWKWEDIRGVEKKDGRLWVNGRDFCAVTGYADVAELWALAGRCAALAPGERERRLARVLRGWFAPARLRRALARVNARTAPLAFLASVNALIALAVSAWFLADAPGLVGKHWAEYFATRALPLIGVYAACVHVAALVAGWRALRKLLPGREHGARRANMLLGAAFLPPQVFRLRAQVAAAALPAQHPLAWLAVVAGGREFREGAARVLRDLRWPLAPARNPDPRITARIASWMRARVLAETERLLAARGLDAGELLAAPEPDGPESRSYCPRCLDQFTKSAGHCTCGTPLAALGKNAGSRRTEKSKT